MLHEVVKMNNIAIGFLRNGDDLDRSFVILKRALKILSRLRISSKNKKRKVIIHNDNDTSALSVVNMRQTTRHHLILIQESMMPIFAPDTDGRPNHNCFLFSQGITMADDDNCSDYYCFDIVYSILLFNLGLVFHLKALCPHQITSNNDTTTNNNRLLTKAKKLYGKSFCVISHELSRNSNNNNIWGSTINAMTDLLAIAIANNLAQIALEFGQYKQSKCYFNAMKRLIRSCIKCKRYQDSSVSNFMHWISTNFFQLNIDIFDHLLLPAPAA